MEDRLLFNLFERKQLKRKMVNGRQEKIGWNQVLNNNDNRSTCVQCPLYFIFQSFLSAVPYSLSFMTKKEYRMDMYWFKRYKIRVYLQTECMEGYIQ